MFHSIIHFFVAFFCLWKGESTFFVPLRVEKRAGGRMRRFAKGERRGERMWSFPNWWDGLNSTVHTFLLVFPWCFLCGFEGSPKGISLGMKSLCWEYGVTGDVGCPSPFGFVLSLNVVVENGKLRYSAWLNLVLASMFLVLVFPKRVVEVDIFKIWPLFLKLLVALLLLRLKSWKGSSSSAGGLGYAVAAKKDFRWSDLSALKSQHIIRAKTEHPSVPSPHYNIDNIWTSLHMSTQAGGKVRPTKLVASMKDEQLVTYIVSFWTRFYDSNPIPQDLEPIFQKYCKCKLHSSLIPSTVPYAFISRYTVQPVLEWNQKICGVGYEFPTPNSFKCLKDPATFYSKIMTNYVIRSEEWQSFSWELGVPSFFCGPYAAYILYGPHGAPPTQMDKN